MPEKIIEEIEKEKLDVHGIEIFRNGDIIFRKIFADDIRFPVYSATKSVTSAAVSIAADEGKISAECYLYEFIEKRYQSLMTDNFKRLTVGRFMSMTSGNYPFRPQGTDWTEYILSLPVDNADNSFHYSNIPAYLVGAACENAVGMNLMDYLMPRLFEPLGIAKPKYQVCPQGHFYGATGMELTVHELCLIGILYLNKGIFGGERIISEERIIDAVSQKVRTEKEEYGYGYFFRTFPKGFSINGKWGQRCMIYPKKQLVIACLSHLPDRSEKIEDLINELAERL